MADYEYLDDFHTRLRARRWLLKAIATCAVFGGVYGASLGSAIGAVPGAADIIGIAAGIFAVLCSVPGARYGFFFGMVNRMRFGRLFVGTVAAIGGAILGGFLATVILLALGAILGAMGGWALTRAVLALRHSILRRFVVGLVGALLGMFLGAILWAIRLNQEAAIIGVTWGFGIGAVVGPLLLLLFIGTLRWLPRTGVRRTFIDASFGRQD